MGKFFFNQTAKPNFHGNIFHYLILRHFGRQWIRMYLKVRWFLETINPLYMKKSMNQANQLLDIFVLAHYFSRE